MTHLRCATCGILLTRECCWGTLEAHNPEAIDRASATASGVMVRLPDERASRVARNGEVIRPRVWSPAGAISTNPSDVLPDTLRSTGCDNGCCGSDGSDGPNRACAACGTVVAAEWSDCWTQAEIRFLPGSVKFG
jgi:hypothetical protein